MDKHSWIKALNTFQSDSRAEVPCPSCNEALLEVLDCFPDSQPEIKERTIRCPECFKGGVLRTSRKDDEGLQQTDVTGESANFPERAYKIFFEKT